MRKICVSHFLGNMQLESYILWIKKMMIDSTKNLVVPVQIISEDNQQLTIVAVKKVASCAKCSSGQGCGQNPWFRGLISTREMTLPRPAGFPVGRQYAELTLSNTILNRLTILTYGLPLLNFFLALFFCQSLPQWLQFIIALVAVGATLWLEKYYFLYILQKKLQIREIQAAAMLYD